MVRLVFRSNRRKLREITITYGRNIQEGKHGHPKKKLHWKKKVLKANCNTSALLQGQQLEQQKKKMEKTLLKPALSEGLQERAVREGNS